MSGQLYLCATPIGNLGDMTERVINCMKEVDIIAAEDTRNSRKLLTHFDIHTPMTSYHEFNKYEKADELVRMLLDGKNIALITDAGTPAISDPGEVLVQKCAEAGIIVTSLPGASAVITALTLSGLSTRRFSFEGFLPRENKDRKIILEEISQDTRTLILYEAPHHLKATLADLYKYFGNRRISLCRELTKKHEDIMRTNLQDAVDYYSEAEPRGEYVLVIEGRSRAEIEAEAAAVFEDMTIEEHVQSYINKGMDKKEAMKQAAKDRGVSKRDIYNALLK
ncbi:16S rRNA (cytidine(1402)-2'-O)-methyltransferase [Lachnospiraceae bacterium C1.1]|nr:16S rRNA (cytidine(1402)-2'-O)-methyltransferase [Lachnospiraceae bacterium C1.1]